MLPDQNLVPPHLQAVQQRRIERITKSINAVKERLTTEINYWENQAEKLKLEERAGKPNTRLNYDNARRRVDELKGRLFKRLEELEQERHLSPKPPMVVGGTLIVPGGLLQRLLGNPQVNTVINTREKERVEKLAIEAVMAVERKQGFESRDVSANRCGYDIESRIPDTGELHFIVVKGRVRGASTVTITKNQIITALNKPNDFILALVEVPESTQLSNNNCTVRYIYRRFPRHSGFAVTSMNFGWQQLWNLGKEM
ncbi:protein NO VEIN domain-containing protein [Funiculus sociatus]|uniref:protein NO VEIN domain-containing protein n=1 Tax=Funiculus sociatus TaxID=450527 RepID=UPI001686D156|nr:DUF3883 domain-containing protein [Trichocoleus sp. FACHB-40]